MIWRKKAQFTCFRVYSFPEYWMYFNADFAMQTSSEYIKYDIMGILHWYRWILSRVGISKDASLRASVDILTRDNIIYHIAINILCHLQQFVTLKNSFYCVKVRFCTSVQQFFARRHGRSFKARSCNGNMRMHPRKRDDVKLVCRYRVIFSRLLLGFYRPL